MEVLEIRGTRDAMFTMRLNMANCFPCSVTWLRKLLKKAIDVSDDPQLYRAELVLYMNDLLAEVTDPEKKASILQEFRDYKEAADHRQPGIDALAEEIEKRKAWINHNLGKKQPKHEARKILKEKRDELATMKKIQRSEYGRSYAAIKALKNMEKDKKNLLECLVVLGQGGETDETIAGWLHRAAAKTSGGLHAGDRKANTTAKYTDNDFNGAAKLPPFSGDNMDQRSFTEFMRRVCVELRQKTREGGGSWPSS